MEPSRTTSHRVVELDSIRGIAALSILLYHMRDELSSSTFHAWWFIPLKEYGWAGVDLFFVLSGYLITTIIVKDSHNINFYRKFYTRRSLRIWPIYYLYLVVCLVAIQSNWLTRYPKWKRGLPYYLFYLQNVPLYWGVTFPWMDGFGHTWTLAIEEQFYLVWPFLIVRFGRRLKSLVGVTLGVALFSALFRRFDVVGGSHGHSLLLGRCDGFALGGLIAVLLALASRDPEARWVRHLRWSFAPIGLLALAYIALAHSLGGGARVPLIHLAVAVMFFGVVGHVACYAGSLHLAPLRLPALGLLGLVSYGLYLYHPLVTTLTMQAIGALDMRLTRPIPALLGAAASVVVALMSWKFIEAPILRLKSLFEYEAAPASTVAKDRATFRWCEEPFVGTAQTIAAMGILLEVESSQGVTNTVTSDQENFAAHLG